MSKHLFPAEVGDLVQVTPQPGDYERTVVVECILMDGRIGVFMPCFRRWGETRGPEICYYNDQQYVVLARGWKENLEEARREMAEAEEAARIKPGDFARVLNRSRQFKDSALWPGSVYRVVEVSSSGVRVNIEGTPLYFRNNEVEKVFEKDRFDNED